MLRLPMLLVLSLSCLACAAGDEESYIDDDNSDTLAVELPQLAAGYAIRASSTVQMHNTEEDKINLRELSITGVATVVQNGPAISMRIKACHLGLPDMEGKALTVKDADLQRVSPVSVEGLLVEISDDSEQEVVGYRFETSPAVLQLGVDLANPLEDSLPESGNDSRIVDADQDGKTGMTARISFFKIRGAAKLVFALSADINDTFTITGDPQPSLSRQAYDDTIPGKDVAEMLAESDAITEFLSQESQFEMTAIPEGTAVNCAVVD